MVSEQAFDVLLTRLRAGDDAAATHLFQLFASQLVAVTRNNLNGAIRQKVDPEDVVQSVFRTFFRRTVAGEFALSDWGDLWGLLVTIALRKCNRHIEFHTAARRDYRREVPLTDADSLHTYADPQASTPTPIEVAAFTDTLELLLRDLDERGRQVMLLRLQGYSVPEISAHVRRTERTVFRTLQRIKARLQSHLDKMP